MPSQRSQRANRRLFLSAFAASAALFTTRGLFAEDLTATPERTEGPFYPRQLPLDQDNDLIVIKDSTTPAVGEITELTGRILDRKGNPIKNATIEIWQCDAKEVYHGTSDSDQKKDQLDPHFQGFGHFTTATDGRYRFRTIKPVPYPGRPAPHIHFKLKKGDRELLTTQLVIAGHPGNDRDGVINDSIDRIDRELLMADFVPVKGTKTPQWTANFDIVLGQTPDERAFSKTSNR